MNKLLAILLFISLSLDPTGELFRLRYISSLCIFLFFLQKLFWQKKLLEINNLQVVYFVVFIFFIPTYGFFIGNINNYNSDFKDTSYIGFSFSLFFMIPYILYKERSYIDLFIKSLRFISYIVLCIFFSFLYDEDQFKIAQFFIDHKSMLFSSREYAGVKTFYLYLTASPLLIFLTIHDSYQLKKKLTLKNFILFTLSSTAIFLTGTRFNMLVGLFTLPVLIFISSIRSRFFIVYSSLILLVFIFAIQGTFISSFFDSSESSNSVKTGYLNGYRQIFSNFSNFIFGQGFNAYYWDSIFRNMLLKSGNEGTRTELTYIEILRVFGFFFGAIINFMLLSIPFILYKKNAPSFIIASFVIYLCGVFFNPYIFSTNGIILFIIFLKSLNKESIKNYDG